MSDPSRPDPTGRDLATHSPPLDALDQALAQAMRERARQQAPDFEPMWAQAHALARRAPAKPGARRAWARPGPARRALAGIVGLAALMSLIAWLAPWRSLDAPSSREDATSAAMAPSKPDSPSWPLDELPTDFLLDEGLASLDPSWSLTPTDHLLLDDLDGDPLPADAAPFTPSHDQERRHDVQPLDDEPPHDSTHDLHTP